MGKRAQLKNVLQKSLRRMARTSKPAVRYTEGVHVSCLPTHWDYENRQGRTVVEHKVDAALALAAKPLPDALLVVAEDVLLLLVAPLLELGNVGDRGRAGEEREVSRVAPERL
jgi:hypothetical protein